MSCAKAADAMSAANAPDAKAIPYRREIKNGPANHRAAARLSSRNGTRESGEGLLLLGRTAEQACHFLFEAVEHRLRLGALCVSCARGIIRRGRRGDLAITQLMRRSGQL